MRRKRMFFYVKNRGNVLLLGVLIAAVLMCMALVSAEIKLRPIVRDMAVSRAKYIATKAINDAIDEEMSSGDVEYEDIVTLQKDSQGKIIALEMNIVKINQLKSAVVSDISNRLQQTESSIIKIPIGNIINGEFFSGRGPRINIKILPVGSVNATFGSQFESAGINQTRHTISIVTEVSISVMLPGGAVSTEVLSEVNIAETILVGNVPDNYTNIEDNQSEILDKINNYVNN